VVGVEERGEVVSFDCNASQNLDATKQRGGGRGKKGGEKNRASIEPTFKR